MKFYGPISLFMLSFRETIKDFVGHNNIIMDVSTVNESPLERRDNRRNNLSLLAKIFDIMLLYVLE